MIVVVALCSKRVRCAFWILIYCTQRRQMIQNEYGKCAGLEEDIFSHGVAWDGYGLIGGAGKKMIMRGGHIFLGDFRQLSIMREIQAWFGKCDGGQNGAEALQKTRGWTILDHHRWKRRRRLEKIARKLISPHAFDINSGHSQAYYIAYCRDNLHRASKEATDRLEQKVAHSARRQYLASR